ncbi:DUF2806 domain-containing protein [Pantoea sp. B623]|uniref:DUF2806 domain-containing protein n=1 Tax=Pantoea TaxID=53335 RepID=UPI000E22668C|nr:MULTISPECIES: DUF2806 domain-containing protein [Pantoea]MCS4493560.1 DUF2806 domain-containing protein [Pantoea sp. B623]REF11657.1 uncharacterized protein DUF2806 [Pantoea ananatis]
MSDTENNSDANFISPIADIVTGIPEPVRKPLLKALGDLVGNIVDVPNAMLQQVAQGIRDTTIARSKAAKVISEASSKEALENSEVMKAAGNVFLPTNLRKEKNKLIVAQKAKRFLLEDPELYTSEKTAEPEDDWMNYFSRFAEDASSEDLQNLFARILSGQILRPKSFSRSTLRTVSELDQDIANDFLSAWSLSVGGAVDYSPFWQIGDGYHLRQRLVEAGLMYPNESSQYLPSDEKKMELLGTQLFIWSPIEQDDAHLNVFYDQTCQMSWKSIEFTRIGKEIGSILPKPDYDNNILNAGKSLIGVGVHRVDFVKADQLHNIWSDGTFG